MRSIFTRRKRAESRGRLSLRRFGKRACYFQRLPGRATSFSRFDYRRRRAVCDLIGAAGR